MTRQSSPLVSNHLVLLNAITGFFPSITFNHVLLLAVAGSALLELKA